MRITLPKDRSSRCSGRRRGFTPDLAPDLALICHVSRGNLAVRSLAEVVSKDDFIPDSEYMETLMVAVPKYVGEVHSGEPGRLTFT